MHLQWLQEWKFLNLSGVFPLDPRRFCLAKLNPPKTFCPATVLSCNGCSICSMWNSKMDNLWCSLKNSSYQWAVTKHVILAQGQVTYNITKVLFDFNEFLHFKRIFRIMLACQTPKIDNLWCSLKNSSYQWTLTRYVTLTQGHVTYNITIILFGFWLIPPLWEDFLNYAFFSCILTVSCIY